MHKRDILMAIVKKSRQIKAEKRTNGAYECWKNLY